jgi:hypothetical protein
MVTELPEYGFIPRFPPRPFTPAGVKGSLNSQFDFLYRKGALVREVAVQVCSPRLVNQAVVVNGLRVGADRAAAELGQAPADTLARAPGPYGRMQGERSERAHAVFGFSGPLAVLSNAAAHGSGQALV